MMVLRDIPFPKDEKPSPSQPIRGQVKWFDPIKGFGFLVDIEGGADVLLHGNVLRSFGQTSIIEGASIKVMAVQTARGRQATEVLSITVPPSEAVTPIAELAALSDADIAALPLLPARVKWFDRSKGFGFANIFGRKGDVFLHLEVLHRFGFADLLAGEAVGLRVFMAGRGMIAAEIAVWEKAVCNSKPVTSSQADPDACGKGAIQSPSRQSREAGAGGTSRLQSQLGLRRPENGPQI